MNAFQGKYIYMYIVVHLYNKHIIYVYVHMYTTGIHRYPFSPKLPNLSLQTKALKLRILVRNHLA